MLDRFVSQIKVGAAPPVASNNLASSRGESDLALSPPSWPVEVPAIHAFLWRRKKIVDGRADKFTQSEQA
jgi:hypothetical protein